MKRENVKQLIPAVLIFLFMYAAGSKLSEFNLFRAQLSIYPFIKQMAPFLSVAIPGCEFIIVAFLLLPATRKTGLYASLITLLVFTVYLVIMVTTQNNLPCSCGGVISQLTWQQHILFNFFFIILSWLGLYLEKTKTANEHLPWRKQAAMEA